ncbi:MAG: hypothetical protein V3U54_08925 [Thermodesulfobacteriota bacterium]
MGFDPKKYLKKKIHDRLDKGIHFKISIDIRKVEDFLKRLFGRRKKKDGQSDKKRTDQQDQ